MSVIRSGNEYKKKSANALFFLYSMVPVKLIFSIENVKISSKCAKSPLFIKKKEEIYIPNEKIR